MSFETITVDVCKSCVLLLLLFCSLLFYYLFCAYLLWYAPNPLRMRKNHSIRILHSINGNKKTVKFVLILLFANGNETSREKITLLHRSWPLDRQINDWARKRALERAQKNLNKFYLIWCGTIGFKLIPYSFHVDRKMKIDYGSHKLILKTAKQYSNDEIDTGMVHAIL